MDKQAYIDEIKFKLTGGILDCELDDVAINKILDASFREIQRYIDTTRLITLPYKNCLDVNEINNGKVNSIVRVFRSQGYMNTSEESNSTNWVDPMYANQWQLLSGGAGNINAFNNYALNFASYNTLLQIRNTVSTDLLFKYDKSDNKLYINISSGAPSKVTIEYIPRFDDLSEIKSDFWIDIICQMAVALSKIALGRIRTRFNQSGALWTQDGDTILAEGKAELDSLREKLQANSQLCYPID